MSAKTDTLETAILNHLLRGLPYTPPSALFLGLFTTAPTDAGGGTEVSGGSYARQAITPATWNAPSGGACTNAGTITFPTASASWGTVVAFGLFDSLTGGTLLIWGTPVVNQTVNSGDVVTIEPGALTISEN
jgi:hypothetical protein